MENIRINTASPYDVRVGGGLLSSVGAELQARRIGRAAVLSDTGVFPLWGEKLAENLRRAGIEVFPFTVPAGEASKNLTVYERILSFFCAQNLTRGDAVITLGGGVVSDLGGFAAATYLRGVPTLLLPTTLLAMVDASVGGKTGVNLPGGKNQVGCFRQPLAVLCDTDTLSTLPPAELLCGWSEIIKYGMLESPSLLTLLETREAETPPSETVIAACIRMKKKYVEADERDTGLRQLLNFGHTVGHALEMCSDYTLPHGKAVAIGMAVLTKAAENKGVCKPGTYARLSALLRRYGLPTTADYPPDAVVRAAMADKKCTDGQITLVLPTAYGACRLYPIERSALADWLRAGGMVDA